MATEGIEVPYIVVVNTNKYAGNFERDMTGFCTGAYGDCTVGDDMAELFEQDVSQELRDEFEDALMQVPDERGCSRPCTIWNSKGNSGYNDVAMYFENRPSVAMVNLIKERAVEFSKRGGYNGKMIIHSVSLIQRKTTVVDTILMELL